MEKTTLKSSKSMICYTLGGFDICQDDMYYIVVGKNLFIDNRMDTILWDLITFSYIARKLDN